MRSYLLSLALLLSLGTLSFASLACITTRTLDRPLVDASRAELATLQSDEWVIEYKPSLPKTVWEAAGADRLGLNEQATKPRLDGNRLQFTSVGGRPREVPIDVLRSIHVKVDHKRGTLDGGVLGLLGGAGFGALIGFAAGSDPPFTGNSDACVPVCRFSAGQKATFGGVVGGVLGLGTGLVVGAILGHREVVELKDANQ